MLYQLPTRFPGRLPTVAVRLLMVWLMALPGCAWRRSEVLLGDAELEHYKSAALQIEYPDLDSETFTDVAATPPPLTLNDAVQDFEEMTLEHAMQTALSNSKVLRDLGGQVLQFPDSREMVRTVLDPAINDTDPRFGTEAALSAFDASFEGSVFFENNDRALNNVFFGGGTRILRQDLHAYQAEISKRSATGADFSIRKIIEYDLNNSPGNNDPNLPWSVHLESEFRQPLLQGAGVDFNRIAGPSSTPGVTNGVLISRINTDISLAEFEIGVRNLANDVENAYWELYYAFHDLDVKIAARDRALETWRQVHALFVNGQRGGEKDREAQSRAQYYRLEEEVQNALTGRLEDRNRTVAFRGVGGVHTAERRLRLLMGLPINSGRLIRPVDEPMRAEVIFSWHEVLAESLVRRVELRQQKWRIKARELELLASRNFLLPRVDVVGRYRFRGLGEQLLNSERDPQRFDNAYQDLTTGDFQEWQLGLEVEVPLGYRQAHSAVRNAELLLARDQAILEEQQREVVHDLSAAIAEVARAYATSQTNYNRRIATMQQLEALDQLYQDADPSERSRLLDLLMDAQRRLTDAESAYYRSVVEYSLAVKNVHLQKGSLLEFNQVFLAEGPWPCKAYFDQAEREFHRRPPGRLMNYLMTRPRPVSQGSFEQRVAPDDALITPAEFRPPTESETLPLPVPEIDFSPYSAPAATMEPATNDLPPPPDEIPMEVESAIPPEHVARLIFLAEVPSTPSWPAGSPTEAAGLVELVTQNEILPDDAATTPAAAPDPNAFSPWNKETWRPPGF